MLNPLFEFWWQRAVYEMARLGAPCLAVGYNLLANPTDSGLARVG